MATTRLPVFITIQSVLDNRTNESSGSRPGSPSQSIASASPTEQKHLRRTTSSPSLPFNNLDSDDTLPSIRTSIYNAPYVLSDEDILQKDNGNISNEWQEIPPSIPRSPSVENFDQFASLPPLETTHVLENIPTSHSNWPVTQLETITEQHTNSTLRTSASLPRLVRMRRSSAANHGRDGLPFIKKRLPYWPAEWTLSSRVINRRFFSESDISCLRPFTTGLNTEGLQKKRLSPSTSSSCDEAFLDQCFCPAFPHQPTHPPPHRSPTPPGLPSFESRDADRLSIQPVPRSTQAATRKRRAAINGELLHSPPSRPTDMIRQLFRRGPSQAEITQNQAEDQAQRAHLPLGVVARAEDGTYVRSRFGVRASGHGVGAGPIWSGLEGHPFNRGSSIQEAIEAIDKACENPEQRRETTLGLQATEEPEAPHEPLTGNEQNSSRDTFAPVAENPEVRSLSLEDGKRSVTGFLRRWLGRSSEGRAGIRAQAVANPEVRPLSPEEGEPSETGLFRRLFHRSSDGWVVATTIGTRTPAAGSLLSAPPVPSMTTSMRVSIEQRDRNEVNRIVDLEEKRAAMGSCECCWNSLWLWCCMVDMFEKKEAKVQSRNEVVRGKSRRLGHGRGRGRGRGSRTTALQETEDDGHHPRTTRSRGTEDDGRREMESSRAWMQYQQATPPSTTSANWNGRHP